MIFVDFCLAKQAKNPRWGGGPPSEAQGGILPNFRPQGEVYRQYPPLAISAIKHDQDKIELLT